MKTQLPPPPANIWVSVTYDLANGLSTPLRTTLANAKNIQPSYNQRTREMTVTFQLEHQHLQRRIATLLKKQEFHLRAHQTAQALAVQHTLTALLIAEREHLIRQLKTDAETQELENLLTIHKQQKTIEQLNRTIQNLTQTIEKLTTGK